jgi:hypothetical protein
MEGVSYRPGSLLVLMLRREIGIHVTIGLNIEEPFTPFGFTGTDGRWTNTSKDWDGTQARDYFEEQRAWWGQLSAADQEYLMTDRTGFLPVHIWDADNKATIAMLVSPTGDSDREKPYLIGRYAEFVKTCRR